MDGDQTDWTTILLSGIRKASPKTYKDIPKRPYKFDEVCFIVNNICSDRPHFKYFRTDDGLILEHKHTNRFAVYPATELQMKLSKENFHRVYNMNLPLKKRSARARPAKPEL